jgi:hypothetical protein
MKLKPRPAGTLDCPVYSASFAYMLTAAVSYSAVSSIYPVGLFMTTAASLLMGTLGLSFI